MTQFSLTPKEIESYNETKEAVRLLHGSAVADNVMICFSCGSGIGVGVKLIFSEIDLEKDITDYDSW
jgi:hypothetical protein